MGGVQIAGVHISAGKGCRREGPIPLTAAWQGEIQQVLLALLVAIVEGEQHLLDFCHAIVEGPRASPRGLAASSQGH